MFGRMMTYLNLIINLQATCNGVIQRAKHKYVRPFEEIPGTSPQTRAEQLEAEVKD